MARVDRVCVRRLKTFEYYGNAAVELCAQVNEGDRLDDVVAWLQVKAEAYVEKQKEVTKLEEYREAVEETLKDVRELLDELSKKKRGLEEKWKELSRLLGELQDAEQDIDAVKSILSRLKKLFGVSG